MKKAIIIVLICIAVIAAGGYGAYRLYMVPKYLEPAMEKAAEVINSDETKETVDGLVSELVEKGVISEEDAEKYGSQKSSVKNDEEALSSDKAESSASDVSALSDKADNMQAAQEESSYTENSSKQDTEDAKQAAQNSTASEKTDSSAQDNSQKSLYDKVMSQVSPSEAKELYSLYSQYGFLAGMSTEEIKQYAKENMSPGEIQHLLDVYSKYSGLLN